LKAFQIEGARIRKAAVEKFRFSPLQTPLGELTSYNTHSPNPLAGFRERKGREKRRRGLGRKENGEGVKGKEGREGREEPKGKQGVPHVLFYNLTTG